MSKSSNHMVKPCLQVAKDLSGEQQMHLLISPILCACFWSCVCPIITLEQHPNETAAREEERRKMILLLHAFPECATAAPLMHSSLR